MLDNPFGEEIFPNVLSKPLMAQLEAVSSHPITWYLGEETDTHLATTSFQVVVESNKVFSEPPFLQAQALHFQQTSGKLKFPMRTRASNCETSPSCL